ncbi:MAG: GFA family protein [Minwuia sp.]|nr:GFA family protein [Minwuia sp.]
MQEPYLKGGCLCGAIRYDVAPTEPQVSVCHCRMCQQWNGAPYFVHFAVAAEVVTWHGKPVEWRSSDIAVRAHCGACGTPLYYKGDGQPELYDIALMTLDDPALLRPTDQIWASSAAAWPGLIPDLPAWPEEERSGEPLRRATD